MQKTSAGKFHFEPPFTSFDYFVGTDEQRGPLVQGDNEYLASAARHSASGRLSSFLTMLVPNTIETILYPAWRRPMPSRPMPQSDEMMSRSGSMYLSASRISAATCSGRSTCKVR